MRLHGLRDEEHLVDVREEHQGLHGPPLQDHKVQNRKPSPNAMVTVAKCDVAPARDVVSMEEGKDSLRRFRKLIR